MPKQSVQEYAVPSIKDFRKHDEYISASRLEGNHRRAILVDLLSQRRGSHHGFPRRV